MNKRQRKKAKDWMYQPVTISLSELEASKLSEAEIVKTIIDKMTGAGERLAKDAYNEACSDGTGTLGKAKKHEQATTKES